MKITYKFVHEFKGQCRIGIMNVRDTSSHGDRRMCQIWLTNVKTKNSYKPDTKTCKKKTTCNLTLMSKVNIVLGSWMNATNRLRQTDRQHTGRRADRVIPIYPLNFVHGAMIINAFAGGVGSFAWTHDKLNYNRMTARAWFVHYYNII